MDFERFIQLLSKKWAGLLTLPEKRELELLINSSEDKQLLYQIMEEFNQGDFDFNNQYSPSRVQDSLQRVNEKIDATQINSGRVHKVHQWIKVASAAAAIIAIVFTSFFYLKNDTPKPAENMPRVIATKKGSKSSIVLPDGTKVWINSDTRLSYNEEAWVNGREVELFGEAYFDVVKNEKKPFVVHTNVMDIKVTGTAFNVRSYDTEKNSEATLIRGSVEVYLNKKDRQKITLNPNEKLVVQNSYVHQQTSSQANETSNQAAVQLLTIHTDPADSTSNETKWVKNTLVFDREAFEDILPVLERWYDVKITVKNNIISDRKFSGTFQNDSLEDVLESFRFSIGFNYTIQKNIVTIY